MEETTLPGRTKKTLLGWLFPTTIAVIVAVRFLDRPISLFIQDTFYHNKIWGHLTGDLPDTLLIMVGVGTVTCYLLYLVRKRSNLLDKKTFLLQHVAWTLPGSFLAKTLLKWLFGRVTTRFWLQNPPQYGFHWLNGADNFNGFPSGHMAVFAALFAAIWRVYPQYKLPLVLLLFVLGILLMATNYHFLSDVIAGWWLGLAVEALISLLLRKSQQRLE